MPDVNRAKEQKEAEKEAEASSKRGNRPWVTDHFADGSLTVGYSSKAHLSWDVCYRMHADLVKLGLPKSGYLYLYKLTKSMCVELWCATSRTASDEKEWVYHHIDVEHMSYWRPNRDSTSSATVCDHFSFRELLHIAMGESGESGDESRTECTYLCAWRVYVRGLIEVVQAPIESLPKRLGSEGHGADAINSAKMNHGHAAHNFNKTTVVPGVEEVGRAAVQAFEYTCAGRDCSKRPVAITGEGGGGPTTGGGGADGPITGGEDRPGPRTVIPVARNEANLPNQPGFGGGWTSGVKQGPVLPGPAVTPGGGPGEPGGSEDTRRRIGGREGQVVRLPTVGSTMDPEGPTARTLLLGSPRFRLDARGLVVVVGRGDV